MDFAEIEEEEEHFSFPAATTRNSPPNSIGSPPLWWHPISPTFPLKTPENSEGKQVANEQRNGPNKYLFQDFKAMNTDKQRKLSSSCDHIHFHESEKMDLLWEAFNEELIFAENSIPREVKMICVNRSKTRLDMLSERRLGILMLFKFFKKVFGTGHHTHNSVENPHRI